MGYKKLALAIAATSLTLAGCSSSGGSSSTSESSSSQAASSAAPLFESASVQKVGLDKAQLVLETNARIAYAAYSDSVDTAVALQTALQTFAAEPTQANLDAAKRAWLVAREPYGQTEVYRFRASPIDSTTYPEDNGEGPEGDINAWPLGEALIDYVVTGTDFGVDQLGVTDNGVGVEVDNENLEQTANIVNSFTADEITIDLISNTATAEDEHDVIAGYHAIEFMLWGQDLNLDGSANTEEDREQSTGGDLLNSGGHRPLTDFTDDQYADRRHKFMQVVAEKLVADLQSVRDAWAEGSDYRTAFTSVSTDEEASAKFTEILTGMGTLTQGELAGERIQIAFEGNSQEDEHSCFSDNTHRDIWLNAEGVSNSYFGVYEGYDSDLDGVDDAGTAISDGYGFDDYLADSEASDAFIAELEQAFASTEAAYREVDRSARIDGNPVDRLILPEFRVEGAPLHSMILALDYQAIKIAQIAEAAGITDVVVDPDASACDTSDPLTSCE